MKRLLIPLYVLLLFLLTSFTLAAPHGRYPTFTDTAERVYTNNGLLTVFDTVSYKQAYYSINGGSWKSVNLRGQSFEGSNVWIHEEGILNYPEELSEPGEHYLAVYSCFKQYTWSDEPWNCHGGWQLIVLENEETDANDPYAKVHLSKEYIKNGGNEFDYQCGTKVMLGQTHNYGNCVSGYECKENLCIAKSNSCTGIVCRNNEYCSHGACLLNVPGKTYFIALWGNDSNSGNYTHPFYSWQKGAEVAQPGDMFYIRGGVWYPTKYLYASSTIGLIIDPNGYTQGLIGGTKDAPIRFYNYPGEKPILDGGLMKTSETRWLSGIGISEVEYIYLKGLTIRHIHQDPPDFTYSKHNSEAFGIGTSGANLRFENIVVHDIDGRGFQHWSDAWSAADAQYGLEWCRDRERNTPGGDPSSCKYDEPLYSVDNTSWINCDAYNLFDRYSPEPGNAADGWKVETYSGSTFTWKNCRAWNYSDDGFDPHGGGTRIFDGCWAMSMNFFADITPLWGTEGNGFKTTGPTWTINNDEHIVIFKNCIAADNRGHGHGTGFITNIVTPDEISSNPLIYNNLAYYNGWSYGDMKGGIVRNNIAYGTRNIGPTGEAHTILGTLPYTESHNTWMYHDAGSGSWPWFVENPIYTITNEDFVSLDMNQLKRPRKADGSLPDITFGHLTATSDLVDSGVVVPGYHCATRGEHPNENCVEWYGNAPDLGPFESPYTRN